MKTFIINLGLGNSPFESINDKAERRMAVHDEVSMLAGGWGAKIQYEWAEGEYEGKPEETMVITLKHPSSTSVNLFARELTRHFTQLCVAVYDMDAESGELVWHDQVVDRPYTFNPNFFLWPVIDTTAYDRITARLPKA